MRGCITPHCLSPFPRFVPMRRHLFAVTRSVVVDSLCTGPGLSQCLVSSPGVRSRPPARSSGSCRLALARNGVMDPRRMTLPKVWAHQFPCGCQAKGCSPHVARLGWRRRSFTTQHRRMLQPPCCANWTPSGPHGSQRSRCVRVLLGARRVVLRRQPAPHEHGKLNHPPDRGHVQ